MPKVISWRMLPSCALVVIVTVTGACTSRKSTEESAAKADAASPANGGGSTEKTLIALENAWPRAVAQRDTATFQRTLAPEFVYTEDSAYISRGDLINGMTSGPDTVVDGGNEDMKVHDFGNTAVVTGVLVLRGRGKDGPFTRRYRYTDTWMLRDGKWQIVAAQDYLIPSRAR